MGEPQQMQDRASTAVSSAKAQLLLARPCDAGRDLLAARLLGALGLSESDLLRGRAHGRNTLVLRTTQGFIGLSQQSSPLGAASFHGAIAPFTPASERGELMRLIEHHEAHIGLRLTLAAQGAAPVALLLQRAVQALGRELGAIGLLWQASGRLLGPEVFAPDQGAHLLVIPRLTTIGPRRLPALRFAGARALLGHRIRLHLLDIAPDVASAAGLAFVEAALADPSLRARQSFAHAGRSFRIAHDGDWRDITLLPVAHVSPLAHAA